jgi:hypothetical protein
MIGGIAISDLAWAYLTALLIASPVLLGWIAGFVALALAPIRRRPRLLAIVAAALALEVVDVLVDGLNVVIPIVVMNLSLDATTVSWLLRGFGAFGTAIQVVQGILLLVAVYAFRNAEPDDDPDDDAPIWS